MTAGRTLRSRLLLAASPRHTASTIGPVSVSSGQRQCVRAYWAVFIATRFERPACERCDLIERPRGELPQLRLAGPFRSRLVGSGRVESGLVWSGRRRRAIVRSRRRAVRLSDAVSRLRLRLSRSVDDDADDDSARWTGLA